MSEFADLETAPAPSGKSLRDFADVVLRRIWVAIFVFAAVAGAGIWVVTKQALEYEATALLVIEARTPRILGEVDPVNDPTSNGGYWSMRDYLETQYRRLSSRSLAEEVARRLDLGNDLAFLGLAGASDPAIVERALAETNIGERVQQAVRIAPVPDSQVVRITATSFSAETAAALANTLAEVFIEQNMDRQVESIELASDWLVQQYDTLERQLTDSETALVRYRQENGILAVELSDNVSLLQEMQAISDQLAAAQLESAQLRTTVEQIDRTLEDGDIINAGISALVDNPVVQSIKSDLVNLQSRRAELAATYLAGHPDMQALDAQIAVLTSSLEREVTAVLDSFRNRYEAAREVEGRLSARLDEIESEARQLGDHQLVYNQLLREAEGNRDLFSMIQRRLKEVEITQNSQQNNAELLEAAIIPRQPSQTNMMAQVVVVVVFALMLAFAVPFGLEALDNTVRTRDSLEREFSLAFLGIIPRVRPTLLSRPSPRGPARGQKWNPDTFVHDFPKSTVAESCRSIRTNLAFLASEKPIDRLLVTSAGPREGKTTSSLSLGTVMAQSGMRVLLVDTDMRRPRLHHVFNLPGEVGLSSILAGEATIAEAVRPTLIPNVFLLPSGPIPPNPTELMHTERFRKVINDLSALYDRVIFDSPPITPVTDAAVLAGMVDGVLLVVKAGTTRKELLHRAVESLRSVRANIVGAVLNDVDLTSRNTGYYNYYYYYRQPGYYGADEETAS